MPGRLFPRQQHDTRQCRNNREYNDDHLVFESHESAARQRQLRRATGELSRAAFALVTLGNLLAGSFKPGVTRTTTGFFHGFVCGERFARRSAQPLRGRSQAVCPQTSVVQDVAKSGIAPGRGPGDRRFKSCRSDCQRSGCEPCTRSHGSCANEIKKGNLVTLQTQRLKRTPNLIWGCGVTAASLAFTQVGGGSNPSGPTQA